MIDSDAFPICRAVTLKFSSDNEIVIGAQIEFVIRVVFSFLLQCSVRTAFSGEAYVVINKNKSGEINE